MSAARIHVSALFPVKPQPERLPAYVTKVALESDGFTHIFLRSRTEAVQLIAAITAAMNALPALEVVS